MAERKYRACDEPRCRINQCLRKCLLRHCQVHDVFSSSFSFIVQRTALLINHCFVSFCCCSSLSACLSLVLSARIDMELRELVNHPHYLLSSLTGDTLFSSMGNSLRHPFALHQKFNICPFSSELSSILVQMSSHDNSMRFYRVISLSPSFLPVQNHQ